MKITEDRLQANSLLEMNKIKLQTSEYTEKIKYTDQRDQADLQKTEAERDREHESVMKNAER